MTPPAQRFATKYRLDPTTGCWVWTASIRSNGYSQFRYRTGQNGYGHVFAYELYIGPIPDGHHLHHVCENKKCVNPAHLEALPPREHVLNRTDGVAARNAAKTHCKRGHPLSGENLYTYPNGRRACRVCIEQWREEHREERLAYHRRYYQEHRDDLAPRAAARYRAKVQPKPPGLDC